jgi:hypothetical protein
LAEVIAPALEGLLADRENPEMLLLRPENPEFEFSRRARARNC